VGTGAGTSINELFRALVGLSGRDVEPRRGPRRPGDVRHSYLDCSKIERELGWQAEVSLRDGLQATWQHLASGQA
jgi:UDP-glucose 4-epimerase